MKKQYTIVLINFGAAILFSAFFAAMDGRLVRDFSIWYGLVGLGGGFIDLFIGLVLLVKQDKSYAQGFLLSGALLMLTGFASCTLVR